MTAATIKNETNSKARGLKEQIIDAASRLLIEEGYDNLSLRHIAQQVGCSQMAMYRHFVNKDALIQHLCVELYTRFTDRIIRRLGATTDPLKQIHIFISELIGFAVGYPDHYSLIFLVRQKDKVLTEQRDELGREFLQLIRRNVADLLPEGTEKAVVDSRLRQIVTALHGAAALLIAHPRAYGLNKEKAIRDMEALVADLLKTSYPGSHPTSELKATRYWRS